MRGLCGMQGVGWAWGLPGMQGLSGAWKTTQMSIRGWVDKEDVVSLCSGLLLGNKKAGSTDACHIVSEP